jgi:Fur family ferric uptake transcriptional regulator
MKDLDENQRILRSRGLKNTKHRMAILRVLSQSNRPLTADEVYLKLRAEGVAISLSTVYRALELLTARGALQKSSLFTESGAVFEPNRSEHRHYVLCLGCHRLIPVDDCPLDEYEAALARRLGFQIEGHKLEIYGYCPKCQQVPDR